MDMDTNELNTAELDSPNTDETFDAPKAESEEDAPFKTLLQFIATWSVIIASISTLLLALIKKYVED